MSIILLEIRDFTINFPNDQKGKWKHFICKQVEQISGFGKSDLQTDSLESAAIRPWCGVQGAGQPGGRDCGIFAQDGL